jgi:hypothetical protein
MSTVLVTALRESDGYLRDGGYDQTAQLVAMAADEIERLTHRVQALEAGGDSQAVRRPTVDRLRQLIKSETAEGAIADALSLRK